MLDKAIAQYAIEAAAIVDAQPPTTEAKRALALSALDAAVKDVALAVAHGLGPVNTNRVAFNEVIAQIERLFEGGKDGKSES